MKKQVLLGAFLSILSLPLFAHPGHGFAHVAPTFSSGFMHPFMGLDHLLVMIAMGVWAAKQGGKAIFYIPFSFIIMLIIGAYLGVLGLGFAGLETAIMATIMAVGLLLVIGFSMNRISQIVITSGFALLHGMAHGIELSPHTVQLSPLFGMVMATIGLISFGFVFGLNKARFAMTLQRALGFLMMFVSVYLLAS